MYWQQQRQWQQRQLRRRQQQNQISNAHFAKSNTARQNVERSRERGGASYEVFAKIQKERKNEETRSKQGEGKREREGQGCTVQAARKCFSMEFSCIVKNEPKRVRERQTERGQQRGRENCRFRGEPSAR